MAATQSHDDERAEAMWVALHIARLDPTLVRNAQVAVLARTHAVLATVRSELSKAGVPVRRLVDGPGVSVHADSRRGVPPERAESHAPVGS